MPSDLLKLRNSASGTDRNQVRHHDRGAGGGSSGGHGFHCLNPHNTVQWESSCWTPPRRGITLPPPCVRLPRSASRPASPNCSCPRPAHSAPEGACTFKFTLGSSFLLQTLLTATTCKRTPDLHGSSLFTTLHFVVFLVSHNNQKLPQKRILRNIDLYA